MAETPVVVNVNVPTEKPVEKPAEPTSFVELVQSKLPPVVTLESPPKK